MEITTDTINIALLITIITATLLTKEKKYNKKATANALGIDEKTLADIDKETGKGPVTLVDSLLEGVAFFCIICNWFWRIVAFFILFSIIGESFRTIASYF